MMVSAQRLRATTLVVAGFAAVAGIFLSTTTASAAGELVLSQDIKPSRLAQGGYKVDYTVTGKNISSTKTLQVTTFDGSPCSTWTLVSGNINSIAPGGSVVWTCSTTMSTPETNQFNLRYRAAGESTTSTTAPTTTTTKPPTVITSGPGEPAVTVQPSIVGEPSTAATRIPSADPMGEPTRLPSAKNTITTQPVDPGTPVRPSSGPSKNPGGPMPGTNPGGSLPGDGDDEGDVGGGGGGIGGGLGGLGGFFGFFQQIFSWIMGLFGGGGGGLGGLFGGGR